MAVAVDVARQGSSMLAASAGGHQCTDRSALQGTRTAVGAAKTACSLLAAQPWHQLPYRPIAAWLTSMLAAFIVAIHRLPGVVASPPHW